MERKMKIITMMEVENCLKSKLLPVKETGLGYHINKNIVILNKAIKEHRALLPVLQEPFIIKDENGEKQLFKLKQEGQGLALFLDEEGNKVKATKEDKLKDSIYDVENSDFQEVVDKWEKDEITVDLFDLPKEKVDECIENGKFDGVDITPLLGILID